MRNVVAGLLATLLLPACLSFQEGPLSTDRPESEFLVVRGRRIHFLDTGKGERAVLLVHGFGASTVSWKPVVPELSKHMRVLAVDLPGFGLSDRVPGDYSPEGLADDLAAFLDQRGVTRASVVGQSWGGSIALAFALRHPDRLDRLVLMSAFCFPDQLNLFFEWAQVPGLGEVLMRLFYGQFLGERLALDFYEPEKWITQEMVDRVEANFHRPGTLATHLAAVRALPHLADLQPHYHEIAAPALVLTGREDRVTLVQFEERLARELPHARLVVLPGCGHILQIECSAPAVQALAEFLQ